jgi:hypothetical protein
MQRLLNTEQSEIQEGTNSVKITIFYDGWKYADDIDTTDEIDIELLIRQLTPGTQITFRTSKNWRNSLLRLLMLSWKGNILKLRAYIKQPFWMMT